MDTASAPTVCNCISSPKKKTTGSANAIVAAQNEGVAEFEILTG